MPIEKNISVKKTVIKNVTSLFLASEVYPPRLVCRKPSRPMAAGKLHLHEEYSDCHCAHMYLIV